MTEQKKSSKKQKRVYPMKQLREELGMTQLELANALGINPMTISRAERGITEPLLTIAQVHKLSELTGKTLAQLPKTLGSGIDSEEE